MFELQADPKQALLNRVTGFAKHLRYYFYKFIEMMEKEAHSRKQGIITDEN